MPPDIDRRAVRGAGKPSLIAHTHFADNVARRTGGNRWPARIQSRGYKNQDRKLCGMKRKSLAQSFKGGFVAAAGGFSSHNLVHSIPTLASAPSPLSGRGSIHVDAFAFMYDISGYSTNTLVSKLTNDWLPPTSTTTANPSSPSGVLASADVPILPSSRSRPLTGSRSE